MIKKDCGWFKFQIGNTVKVNPDNVTVTLEDGTKVTGVLSESEKSEEDEAKEKKPKKGIKATALALVAGGTAIGGAVVGALIAGKKGKDSDADAQDYQVEEITGPDSDDQDDVATDSVSGFEGNCDE